MPHRQQVPRFQRQPLETIPPASERSPRRKDGKDRCVCRQAGVRKDSFAELSFALFTLASRCSRFNCACVVRGLGAACHKASTSHQKQSLGPAYQLACGRTAGAVAAGLAGVNSAVARAQIEKHASGRWAAGSRWRRWSLRPGRWSDRARAVHRVTQDGQSPQVQIARIYIDAGCNPYGAWLRCWTLCRSMTP